LFLEQDGRVSSVGSRKSHARIVQSKLIATGVLRVSGFNSQTCFPNFLAFHDYPLLRKNYME
jgi:hypothetical protein